MSEKGLLDLKADRLAEPEPVPLPPFRWKTRVLLPGAVVVGFIVLFVGSAWNSLLPEMAVEVLPVVEREGTAPSSSGAVMVQAAGWIEPAPYAINASALTAGTVAEVLALEGESVEKGDVLARLIDDDALLALRKSEAMVAERKAMHASAAAAFAAADVDWNEPVERQRAADVSSAQLRETEAELARVEDEVEEAAAFLRDAESLLNKNRDLAKSGVVSDTEWVSIQAQYDASKARLRAMENRRRMLEARKERDEAESGSAARHLELRTADRERLDQARAALARAAADVELAEVELEEARLRVSRLEVKAPISGVVMRRFVEPGSRVDSAMDDPAAGVIASLYDPRSLQVRVDVPLGDAGRLYAGQSAEISAEVLPDRSFKGTVSRVTHYANIQKNTLEVKVAIDDPAQEMRPEMLARVRFLSGSSVAASGGGGRSTIMAPIAAIQREGSGATSWVVGEFDGSRGVLRRATMDGVGNGVEGWASVQQGLKPGDLLVVNPPAGLTEGRRVRVSQSRSTTPQGGEQHGLH